jgi:hypothetical protein
MPTAKLTLQQQRERKQKILLAVLGVVLLAVLAFQLPKLLGGKSSASAATTTAVAGGTTTPATGASLVSGSVTAAVQTGGLSSFERFTSKNPFKSQISTNPGSTASTGAGAAAGGAAAGAAKAKTKPATPPVKFSVVPPATTTDTGPLVPAVVLKLNGARRVILVGSSFPRAEPVFTLESVGKNAMWISLVGGSFEGGRKTLEIKRGHPLKLVNATANLRYVIRLVRVTTAHPPKTAPAATTSATTTAATTTAPATTTGPTTTGP